MEIPLLLGRNVSERDTENSPPVAVVNERFAQRYFPGESPIGRTFTLRGRPVEIVGVARDARYHSLRDAIPVSVYLPFRQEISGQANFAIRTTGEPGALATAIRGAVREVDANLPIFELRSQEEQITRHVAQERLFATLTSIFGGLALLLTCIGLYGLLAHQVTARTREIGIRMALGASKYQVFRAIVGDMLLLTAVGIAAGIAGGAMLTRYLEQMLFELTPLDPAVFIAMPVVLASAVLAAAFLSARPALTAAPLTALRHE
jgi:predicted permease